MCRRRAPGLECRVLRRKQPMRKLIAARQIAIRAAAFAMMLAALATLEAQQTGGGAGAAAPKPLLPVSANTLSAHPDSYYGESITITAAVDQILSPSTFTVSQRTAP